MYFSRERRGAAVDADARRALATLSRAPDAASELGDPFVLARTLLMAGWVPFWRQRLDEAEALFREALEVIRASVRDALT